MTHTETEVNCIESAWLGPASLNDPGIFFFDTFEDPDGTDPENHTPNLDLPGNGWNRHGESWEIQSDQLEYTGASFATQQITTEIGISDNIAVSVKITQLPTGAGSRVGVVLRFKSFLDAEYIEFKVQPDNDAWFIRANNGGGTLASGVLATPFAVDDVLELRAQGPLLSAFHNGESVGSVQTSSFQSETEAGIYVQDEGGVNALFDAFTIGSI